MSVRAHAAAILIACVSFAGLSGCTTSSYNCTNNTCSVRLKGSGSDTQLFDDGVTVTLEGADGTTADLDVDGESFSCKEGDAETVGQVDVTCMSVGDDEVELELVR